MNSTDTLHDSLPSGWKILASGLSVFLIGTTAILFNTIILIIIRKNKKLHTPCFYMIACQASYSMLMGVSFVTDGIHRIGIVFDLLPFRLAQGWCLLLYWTKTMSHSPSAFILCAIGLDRFIAITIDRSYYLRWANKIYYVSILSSFAIGVTHEIVGVLTAPKNFDDTILCLNYFAALHHDFVSYTSAFDLCLFVLSIVINGLIIVKVKRTLVSGSSQVDVAPVENSSTSNPQQPKEKELFFKKQLALVPLIKSIMAAFILVGIAPQILSSIAPYIGGGQYQVEIILYESVLRALGAVTDFMVLTVKCKEFRSTLVTLHK